VGKISSFTLFANFCNSKPKGKMTFVLLICLLILVIASKPKGKMTFLDHVKLKKNVLIFCGVQNTSKVFWIQTAVEKVSH